MVRSLDLVSFSIVCQFTQTDHLFSLLSSPLRLFFNFTSTALKEDQEEYLEAGADHVLTKPLKEANMREMIELARKRSKGGAEVEVNRRAG